MTRNKNYRPTICPFSSLNFVLPQRLDIDFSVSASDNSVPRPPTTATPSAGHTLLSTTTATMAAADTVSTRHTVNRGPIPMYEAGQWGHVAVVMALGQQGAEVDPGRKNAEGAVTAVFMARDSNGEDHVAGGGDGCTTFDGNQ